MEVIDNGFSSALTRRMMTPRKTKAKASKESGNIPATELNSIAMRRRRKDQREAGLTRLDRRWQGREFERMELIHSETSDVDTGKETGGRICGGFRRDHRQSCFFSPSSSSASCPSPVCDGRERFISTAPLFNTRKGKAGRLEVVSRRKGRWPILFL